MNILAYLMESRGVINAMRRLPTIAWRFGLTPGKMERALKAYVEIAHAYGARPTLAATSVLLERHPKVFQWLKEEAELAIHGYVHTDYRQLDEQAQAEHMERSLEAFQKLGIQPKGFRCPYLRWNDESMAVAAHYGLTYGSNRSVALDVIRPETIDAAGWAAYEKGLHLYDTKPISSLLSLPSRIDGTLLDIPACLPDDEAMIDRLGLDSEQRAATWIAMFQEIYKRGELLTLILHHERVAFCSEALEVTLRESRRQALPVYVASLGEIADWWLRRSQLSLWVEPIEEGVYGVVTPGDDDVTVLVRGAQTEPTSHSWDGEYRVAPPGTFIVRSEQAPVVSLDRRSPPALKAFLKEEGYVVWEGATEGLRLNDIVTFGEKDKRKVLERIENSNAPLVRIWRWPNRAHCAVSVTGDIDAMTLVDFLRRPFEV